MKNLITLLPILLLTMTSMAQNTQNIISVSGNHEYKVQPELTAKMMISLNNIYYDAPGMTFPEIKTSYMNNLSKAGISKAKISEDDLAYTIMGYEKEGTIIAFKTTSIEELKTFLGVKSLGVSRSETTMKFTLTDEEMANYAKLAFENAKSKAEALAKKIGRTVGKVSTISDNNSNKVSGSLYYTNEINTRDYYISVSFELL
ncbi:MAG: SIMPL domain-containing protein [Cellulophaga sp.]|nr:SIMPL domain-containing protein [Cellulophaga sp.]